MYKTISFYRYTKLDNPEELRDSIRISCQEKGILGRILVGNEGINGAISGKEDSIDNFKQELQQKFTNLTFREHIVSNNSYHKLVVKVRKEICVFGQEVNLSETGEYLTPAELERWYGQGKKFTIVDARNDYEFDVGHFKDAIKLPIKTFSEFPKIAPQLLVDKKDKTVVLYCTGGIRCEKASAFLKQQGFSQVYHVQGGIISYKNQFSQHWQGGLFVFDDRLVEEGKLPLNKCTFCNIPTDKCQNCFNLDCDKIFVACDKCLEKMHCTCSVECLDSPRQRKIKKEQQLIGRVIHYYSKAKIAAIKPLREYSSLDSFSNIKDISFQGKTTSYVHKIDSYAKDDEGIVTMLVREKVRKNDLVFTN